MKATIRKIWTGKDQQNRPIVRYYFDGTDDSVRAFGTPKYQEGQEVEIVENDEGYFQVVDRQPAAKTTAAPVKNEQRTPGGELPLSVLQVVRFIEADIQACGADQDLRIARSVAWKVVSGVVD